VPSGALLRADQAKRGKEANQKTLESVRHGQL
jgi:hypothetical protein